MSEKSSEEKAEERASLLRQGAGNYASLCGVLAGFVMVIIVLVLTPGFFPSTDTNMLAEFVVAVFTISSIGYVTTALSFIAISGTPLWEYKSFEDMEKDYYFDQALLALFSLIFLGGVAMLAYSRESPFMTITALVGFILLASSLIKTRWALARRPPPKKTK